MGDILFTTNNAVLVNKHRKLPALDCQQRKAPKMMPTEENIANSNKKGFKNKVGSITNIGTSMLNLQSKFEPGSAEWDELEYRVICIQHFQQLSIDSVKGIKMSPMNPEWNVFSMCMTNDDDDDETVARKEFNKTVCADKKPFFFIYRYNQVKSEYDKYVKAVDSKLKQKYNVSLKELLNSTTLSPDLQREYTYFFNKCPVDMSPGTINRIAWAVDKKFQDFTDLPRVKFDKEEIKSEAEYSMSDFYAVRDVYQEYKSYIVNLVKSTKKDEVDEDEMSGGVFDKAMIDLMFKSKFYEVCSNEKVLCNILIDLLYDKPNSKGVVWDMCGDTIIENLLEKSNYIIHYPEVVQDGVEFNCCRKRFKMKELDVRGDIDGEI